MVASCPMMSRVLPFLIVAVFIVIPTLKDALPYSLIHEPTLSASLIVFILDKYKYTLI